jgi:hypothetical protein
MNEKPGLEPGFLFLVYTHGHKADPGKVNSRYY